VLSGQLRASHLRSKRIIEPVLWTISVVRGDCAYNRNDLRRTERGMVINSPASLR
jgi:hypothetical protein